MHLYTSNPERHDLSCITVPTSHMTGNESGRNKQRRDRICEAEGDAGRPHHDACASLHGYRLGGDLLIITAPVRGERAAPAGECRPAGPRPDAARLKTTSSMSPALRGRRSIRHSPCGQLDAASWSVGRSAGCSIPMERRDRAVHGLTPGDPAVKTAPPLYSVWMFDPQKNTLLPVMPPVEGTMVTDIVAAQRALCRTSSWTRSGSGYRSDAGERQPG